MIQPRDTYVHLAEDGSATQLDGAGFWNLPPAQAERFGGGWLISEFAFDSDWPNWEMHPDGDEFVYLLSGKADVYLEEDGVLRVVTLHDSGAVVVPRGVWHTAKVRAPTRILHVTRGAGTQHRPV